MPPDIDYQTPDRYLKPEDRPARAAFPTRPVAIVAGALVLIHVAGLVFAEFSSGQWDDLHVLILGTAAHAAVWFAAVIGIAFVRIRGPQGSEPSIPYLIVAVTLPILSEALLYFGTLPFIGPDGDPVIIRGLHPSRFDYGALLYPGGVLLIAIGLACYALGRARVARLTPRRGAALLTAGLVVGGILILLRTFG